MTCRVGTFVADEFSRSRGFNL